MLLQYRLYNSFGIQCLSRFFDITRGAWILVRNSARVTYCQNLVACSKRLDPLSTIAYRGRGSWAKPLVLHYWKYSFFLTFWNFRMHTPYLNKFVWCFKSLLLMNGHLKSINLTSLAFTIKWNMIEFFKLLSLQFIVFLPHFGANVCVHTVITNGFSSFHCSCTILKSRGQRYPCHFLCQRSWVTCGKDIDQGRLIYVPAMVFNCWLSVPVYELCVVSFHSWLDIRWHHTARQLRKSGEDYAIIYTLYWSIYNNSVCVCVCVRVLLQQFHFMFGHAQIRTHIRWLDLEL